MIGETIKNIYAPKEADWFVVETNNSFYSLRLGGIKTEHDFDSNSYEKIETLIEDKIIAQVYTDDFSVFIETIDGDTLHHSDAACIDSEGEISFGVFCLQKEQFAEIKRNYEAAEDFPLSKVSQFD